MSAKRATLAVAWWCVACASRTVATPDASRREDVMGDGSDAGVTAGLDVTVEPFDPAPGRPAACSAGGWCWEHPRPVGGNVIAVASAADDEAWALTEDGVLLRWDGSLVSASRLYDVLPGQGESPLRPTLSSGARGDLWVGLARGVVHRSAAGLTRVLVHNGLDEPYLAWSAAPNDVWLAGSVGDTAHWDGARWTRHLLPEFEDLAQVTGRGGAVWAVDVTRRVWQWRDGRWSDGVAPAPENTGAVWMTAPGDAWACGGGLAYRWDGSLWGLERITNEVFSARCEVWSDGADVWSSDGVFTRQRGARGWSLATNVTLRITAVGGSPENLWSGGAAGELARQTGDAWEAVTEARTQFPLTCLHGSAGDDVWAVGVVDVLHFNGRVWESVRRPVGVQDIHGIWSPSPGRAWIVGSAPGVNPGGVALRWAGDHFESASASVPSVLRAVFGTREDDVWAVGDGGLILHYDGSTWTRSPSGTPSDLKAVFALALDRAWAVGNPGAILAWDGRVWIRQESGTAITLTGVHAGASGDVYVVGHNRGNATAALLRWDGARWTHEEDRLPERFLPSRVWVSPDGSPWLLGGARVIRRDGARWVDEALGTHQGLDAIWGSGRGDLRVAGEGGAILARH